MAANIANTGTTEEPVSEIRPVGGLANDRLYYVIVVDETTIKLADTFADATNATPVAIPLTAVVTAADLLTITRDVLTTERSFAQNQITSNRIVFAENPGFVEGQAVVYDRGVGSTALGGLSDDHVYFVKLVAGSPNVIELAATPGGATLVLTAVGDTSTDTLAPAASFDPSSASVRNNEITFVGDHSFADGETIVYRPGDGNTAVGGLISGQSYVVIRVDDNTIQLTNEAGGSPIGIGASRTATLVPVITAPLAALVAADLNRRIEGAGLYDSVLFADIALRPETELLVAQFADGNSGPQSLASRGCIPGCTAEAAKRRSRPSGCDLLRPALHQSRWRRVDHQLGRDSEHLSHGQRRRVPGRQHVRWRDQHRRRNRRQQHGHAGHVTDRSTSCRHSDESDSSTEPSRSRPTTSCSTTVATTNARPAASPATWSRASCLVRSPSPAPHRPRSSWVPTTTPSTFRPPNSAKPSVSRPAGATTRSTSAPHRMPNPPARSTTSTARSPSTVVQSSPASTRSS